MRRFGLVTVVPAPLVCCRLRSASALLAALPSGASNFEGRVVDFLTGGPAAGVQVVAKVSTDIKEEMSRETEATDGDGNYRLTGSLPGEYYTFRASGPGM